VSAFADYNWVDKYAVLVNQVSICKRLHESRAAKRNNVSAVFRLTLATYWYRVGRDDTYLRGLKIMVSPVRIRVLLLKKVLQIAEKYRDSTELPKPLF